MNKPVLPIDNLRLSSEEYKRLRESLEAEKLDDKTLEEIIRLFGVYDNSTGRICCDEAHQHRSFNCAEHYHPATAVVHRLLLEVQRYKTELSGIQNKINKALPK